MSCQMVARVSSALELTEFHSLSPPCDHSAETPGPLMPQPGALLAGNSIQEGLSTGSCRASALIPCMFSVSYQRYSELTGEDWNATIPVAVCPACKRDACAPLNKQAHNKKRDGSDRSRFMS